MDLVEMLTSLAENPAFGLVFSDGTTTPEGRLLQGQSILVLPSKLEIRDCVIPLLHRM